jgi:large subunit ribosomal protein L18
MIHKSTYNLQFKRKREGRTCPKKRLKMLLAGKPRLVVRKSLKGVQVLVAEYEPKGDKILLTINSSAIIKLGWKADTGNLPSAYLTGLLAGKKAIEKGVKEAILDIGNNMPTKGSRLYAVLAGAADSGLKIPFDKDVLPSKERLSGEHIAKYAQSLKDDRQKYEKYFSNYIKNGMNPSDIVKHFNEIKGKIHG